MSNNKKTFISLFSGCGGFDLGFVKNRFECLGAYDNDKSVIEVYKNNIGDHIYEHDLTSAELPNHVQDVDVVISGSPCQGFSTAGLRNYEDPRNSLLLAGGKIAVKHNARVFVAENVMGSMSGRHKQYWEKLINFLSKNGFHTKITICDALKLGLPQTRRRVILYAWKGKGDIDIKYNESTGKTLRDVITNINGAPNKDFVSLDKGSLDYMIARKIKPGKKLCDVRGGERSIHSWDIPEVYGECSEDEKKLLMLIQKLRRRLRRRTTGDADPVALNVLKEDFNSENTQVLVNNLVEKKYLVEKEQGYFDIKRSFNGKYRRLEFDSPSFTIDTNFGNPRYFLHPKEDRGFSVREAARIQGFKDEFEFSGSISQQFRMIGNAVPPPMSEAIAKNVIELLDSNET